MNARVATYGRHVAPWMVGGAALAVALFAAFVYWQETVSPSSFHGVTADDRMSEIPPFADDNFIYVPFDRQGDRMCLARSTFKLVREHLYPPPLGQREDEYILKGRNTQISDLGANRKLLWFDKPAHLAPGDWTLRFEAGWECGGWFNPGITALPTITLGRLQIGPNPSGAAP